MLLLSYQHVLNSYKLNLKYESCAREFQTVFLTSAQEGSEERYVVLMLSLYRRKTATVSGMNWPILGGRTRTWLWTGIMMFNFCIIHYQIELLYMLNWLIEQINRMWLKLISNWRPPSLAFWPIHKQTPIKKKLIVMELVFINGITTFEWLLLVRMLFKICIFTVVVVVIIIIYSN